MLNNLIGVSGPIRDTLQINTKIDNKVTLKLRSIVNIFLIFKKKYFNLNNKYIFASLTCLQSK